MVLYQPLEALHHNGGECCRVVIIKTSEFFRHWDDGSSVETRWFEIPFQMS